ncbi:hypothetical protein [Goodfellowiella coeruleoviolacea]|uniref:Uncharacterized protein n=1 Tax=Goodfellowiella coeruleoviolacea TaxID=334858 RepID=A0AAE3GFX0_9PSEU|nr:hypothetical protein [Goodfellowiella coeruleoviolacea]MCP2167476.1 hypothetical protein [Goodfellowiella coeruleoviolacea]
MGYGMHWREAAALARREAEDVAADRGFGAHRRTVTLTGGQAGCAALFVTVLLLIPGLGLLISAATPLTTGIGAGLTAVAVALPVLTLWLASRTEYRLARLHLFDGGLVLTQGATRRAHPWTEITLVDRTVRGSYGQNATPFVGHRLELHLRDGAALCRLGAGSDEADLVRRLVRESGPADQPDQESA